MNCVSIATVGAVDPDLVLSMEEMVEASLGLPTEVLPALPQPRFAWDPARGQYSSSAVLDALVELRPRHALKLLALTEADLFIPMLTFIFGQAQLGGGVAVISLRRLHQEFYGMPADPDLLFERACKEALHELGHTFGLIHCPGRACVMSLSTNIRQVDIKGPGYCAGCASLLNDGIRRAASKGMEVQG